MGSAKWRPSISTARRRISTLPPDHPLYLLLADIAAQHGVPIDLHMEAVPADDAFARGLEVAAESPSASCQYCGVRTPAGAQSARQNYLGACGLRRNGLSNARPLPPFAARASQPVHGNQDRSPGPREKLPARGRQDQAGMAQALRGFSGPLHHRQRPALSRAKKSAAALAGGGPALQSASRRFEAQDRHGKCCAYLRRVFRRLSATGGKTQ